MLGATMGSRDDFAALLRLCERTGVRPVVDTEVPLARAREAFERLEAGTQFGKVVVTAA